MEYKVGDKVRVKEDLDKNKTYGLYMYTNEMSKYAGKETIIKNFWCGIYSLEIDNGNNGWTEKMLEPVIENKQFTKEDFKFGDIVTVRNGKIFIYTVGYIVDEHKYTYHLQDYNEKLEYWEDYTTPITELDIMKIERYTDEYKTTGIDCKLMKLETLYERKEEILTKEEKDYLRNIISAFEVKILFIRKDSDDFQIKLGIAETFYPTIKLNLIKYKFEKMEDGKEYTLEELGL